MKSARVAKGTAYIAIQNGLQYLTSLFFYVAVAHLLSREDVGKITLLNFTLMAFNTLTTFAIPVASTKFISEKTGKGMVDEASAASRTAFVLVLAISLPSLVLASVFSPWLSNIYFGAGEDAMLFLITFVSAFLLNLTTLYGAEMRGLGMFTEMATAGLAFILSSRLIGVILAWAGYGVLGVVSGWLIGAVICLIISRRFLKGKFQAKENQSFSKRLIIDYSYPVFTYTTISFVQSWTDVVILYALTSNLASEAMYYLAAAGSTLLSIVWTATSMTMLPAISAKHGRREGIDDLTKTSTRLLNLIVIPVSLSLAAASHSAITLAYGADYTQGAAPFAILTATSIVQGYLAIFVTALEATGETGALMKISAASAITGTVLIVILARPLGMVGAAIARSVMFAASLVLCHRALKKRAEFKSDTRSLKKALMLSIALAVPIAAMDWTLTNTAKLNLPTRITIETTYFTLAGLIAAKKLKPFETRDFELLKKALPKQPHPIINRIQRLLS